MAESTEIGLTDYVDLSGNGKGVALNTNDAFIVPDQIINQYLVENVSGSVTVLTRTALSLLSSSVGVVILVEEGYEGLFQFSGNDLSAQIIADTYQGLYVAPTADATGASGAWVRVVTGPVYRLTWWGVTENAPATARICSALNLIPAGATLQFPPYALEIDDNDAQIALGLRSHIPILKPVELAGVKGRTVLNITHVPFAGVTFCVMTSKVKIHGFTMTGLIDSTNVATGVPINIGGRNDYTIATPQEIEDIEVYDNILDCSSGIRVAYQPWIVEGVPLSITPRRIKIYNNHVTFSYQGIRPEADDIEIYGNTLVFPAQDTLRPFASPFRTLGAKGARIHHNTIYNDTAAPTLLIQASGVDGYPVGFTGSFLGDDDGVTKHEDFRVTRDLSFHDNRVITPGGTFCEIQSATDLIRIERNSYEAPLTRTTNCVGLNMTDNAAMRHNHIVFANNALRGISQIASLTPPTNIKHLVIKDNVAHGNQFGNGIFEVTPISIVTGGVDVHGNSAEGVELLEVTGNKFVSKGAGQGFGIAVTGSVAGSLSIIHDNMFPESASVATIGGGGAGSVITSPGGTASVWDAGTYTAGHNGRYPVGTWDRLRTDQIPYNSTDPL